METIQPNLPEDKADSIADYHDGIRQIELEGYALGIKKARNALFLTAGLVFAAEMIAMFTTVGGGVFNIYVFIIALIEAGIFIGLALWTKKKPYTAIVTGLVIFLALILFAAIANGYLRGATAFFGALVGGFIFKILIIVNLVRALANAKALQNAKEEIV